MRYLLLLLLVLTPVVHADQILSNKECLQLYKTFLTDYENTRSQPGSQMIYFAEMCIPELGLSDKAKNSRYDDLVNAMATDEQILALEANLLKQRFQQPMK